MAVWWWLYAPYEDLDGIGCDPVPAAGGLFAGGPLCAGGRRHPTGGGRQASLDARTWFERELREELQAQRQLTDGTDITDNPYTTER